MDVPPSGGDGGGGADLDLDAEDDDIRRELRRRRPREEAVDDEQGTEERIVKTVKQMRKVKHKNMAPVPMSLEEKAKQQRIFPREIHIMTEMAAVRPILCAMEVPDALRLAHVLRAVREVLWIDDGIWSVWWHRDFPEVQRDLPPEDHLPVWITDAKWITDLTVKKANEQPAPQLVALAKMPWRRWYQWSVFFRRSALWHCAAMQNKIAQDWLAEYPENPETDEDGQRRPSNVLATGEIITLSVPAFSEERGLRRGLVLKGSDGQLYFAAALYEQEDVNAFDPIDATNAVVAAAHSSVFWFLEYARSEINVRGGSALRRRFKNMGHHFRFHELLLERPFPASLLLGGTTAMTGSRLNIAYLGGMRAYCTWYARRFQSQSVVPVFTRGEGYHFLENWTDEIVRIFLTRALPPFPAANGVWFVGEPMRPACVGCNVATELTIFCKTCGLKYCGLSCHAANWERKCGDCVRGE